MREDLSELWSLLTHSVHDPADAAAWRRRSTLLSAKAGSAMLVAILLANLLFWPTDPLVLDERMVQVFLRARGAILAFTLVGLAGLRLPALRARAPGFLALVLGTGAAAGGYGIGFGGGLDQPWYYVIFATIPLSVVILVPFGTRLALTALVAFAYLGAFLLPWPEKLAYPYLASVVAYTGFVVGLTTLIGHAVYHLSRMNFLQQRALAEQADALAEAHARSEALLHNILPAAVAERLKAEEWPISDAADAVTVLFADICEFTPRAQACTGTQVVELLDAYFTELDELAEAHGLEKIKTIGDAYVAAAGVPVRRQDHAQAVARFALELVRAAARHRWPDGSPLRVRVGLHSGPVLAGVIGRRRFAWDLWGDTMNTAARMESHGEPGRVHLSEATARAVAEEFHLRERGEVQVKGKGSMRTWWLEG